MTSHTDIQQLYDTAFAELERRLAGEVEQKVSPNSEALILVSNRESSILSFIKETCHSEWMCQMASTHPASVIDFLNTVHANFSQDSLWDIIHRDIQTSDVYRILQNKHPEKCVRFLNIKPVSEDKLRDIAVLSFFEDNKIHRRQETPSIDNQFRMAASDFQTIKQVWDVRDEVRRRLIINALIGNNFKTRDAAKSIGCKTDGALAGNVRVLFGTPDFKRETIEPVITGWRAQTHHPFQPVIEDLVALGTLPMVEGQIKKFYPDIIMKSAAKCQFVKVRMGEFHGVSERTLTTYISDLKMEEEFARAHKAFLEKACRAVGYNTSQVATLLNVDVRLVTQQMAHYGLEKPSGSKDVRTPWTFE